MLSGGSCVISTTSDYSLCAVRCWGFGSGPVVPRPVDAQDYVGWTYSKSPDLPVGGGTPQGSVATIAGSGVAGFADGIGSAAQFNSPQDLTVDRDHRVYVADTNNHCIRQIDWC